MANSNDILIPKVLIIPTGLPHTMTSAQPGTLLISGAKLYVCVTTGTFELVTSS